MGRQPTLPVSMRSLLLLPVLALAACGSPCDTINGAQADPALQTCVFSASLEEDGTGSFAFDDGTPVPFEYPERLPPPTTFPDGSSTWGGVWVAADAPRPASAAEAQADSARKVYTAAVGPTAYALGMHWTGEVRLHSADGDRQSVVRVAEGIDENAARLGIDGWPNRATHLAFAPDGATLFGSDTQRHVTAWDAATGTERWTVDIPEDESTTGILYVAPSPDGSRVAISTARGVHVLDAASGAGLSHWSFPKTKTYVSRAEWTPDGQHLAVMKGGRWVPPSTTYSSFDHNGQRTSTPTMQRSEGYQSTPTVFLLRVPG